jgi:hypothetical protein
MWKYPRPSALIAAMMWGEESSSKSESSGDNEEDEEGEIISSPCSPHPQSLTLPSDLFGQQIRVPASACLVKHPRVDTCGVFSLSSWPGLTLVCSVL